MVLLLSSLRLAGVALWQRLVVVLAEIRGGVGDGAGRWQAAAAIYGK